MDRCKRLHWTCKRLHSNEFSYWSQVFFLKKIDETVPIRNSHFARTLISQFIRIDADGYFLPAPRIADQAMS